jgi:flagellin
MATYLQTHIPNGGVPNSGPDPANASATATAATGTATIPGTAGLSVSVGGFTSVTLNTDASSISSALGNLTTAPGAATAQSGVLGALAAVSNLRATLGASEQQLTSVSNSLGIQVENFTSAYSQIRDANLADEVVNLTRFQVLQQSGTSALAQANQSSKSILSLIA